MSWKYILAYDNCKEQFKFVIFGALISAHKNSAEPDSAKECQGDQDCQECCTFSLQSSWI